MPRDLGSWECSMSHNSSRHPEYIQSFECERFYRGWRYYWMICAARKPDELVFWGYARTRELAEAAARNEVNKLVAGLTRGRIAKR